MDFVLAVLGCLLVVEGLPYIAFPGKVRNWSASLQEAPDSAMRLVGLAAAGSGLLMLFATRIL